MRTILNLLSILSLTSLIYFGYVNKNVPVQIEIPLLGFSAQTVLMWVVIVISALGFIFGLCYSIGLYRAQKIKAEAYYRELEKASINSIAGDDKVKVLENKIEVLEKALSEALKKKD